MPELEQVQPQSSGSIPPFRVDVKVHDLLTKTHSKPFIPPPPSRPPLTLPEPVFPHPPELLGDAGSDIPRPQPIESPYRRISTTPLIYHTMRGWLFPYINTFLL